MNAKRVNAAAGVVHAAMQSRQTAAGIAAALEAACLLQSPETAVEADRLRARVDEVERAYVFDTAALKRRVAELESERHSTNEALSKAVERVAELEALTPAPIQTCRTCGAGYTLGQPCSTCEFQARMASELAARQQPVEESYDSIPRFSAEEIARWQARQAEDPHDSPLHHDYALGRDLPTTHPTDAGSAL